MRLADFCLFAIGIYLIVVSPAKSVAAPAASGSAQLSSNSASVDGGQLPAEAIQSLTKALAGTWSTRESYSPMYLTPKGGAGKGQQTFHAGPGGFTLLENYHSNTPAGQLFGVGIFWWDNTKGLRHMWCINVYPTGCEMFPPSPQPGPKWDGKSLVLHIEGEQNGKKFIWHEVISNITLNSFTQTTDIGESNKHLSRWFTIHAVRVAGRKGNPGPPASK